MKPMIHPLSAVALAASTLLLAACGHNPSTATPDATLPAQYANSAASSAGPAINAEWWTLFNDAALNELVTASLKGNTDLAIAASRVAEAQAVLDQARGAQWPEIDAQASAVRSRASTLSNQPITVPTTSTYRAGLATSFELDFWGRLRNTTSAARAQLLASQDARDTVRIGLVASTAQAYFALRAYDAQLSVNEAAQKARSESLDLVQRRAKGGLGSPLDLAQAQAALAAITAQRPELQRQRDLLENQLGLLTGQPGLALKSGGKLPDAIVPPAGLPSDLLKRRADIRQAENQLRAAQAQVEVVRAAMFPTITLSGSIGGQSAELSDLLKSGARVWSIGPSLLFPLIDGGRNESRTAQARAQAETAAAGYQKAVQTAFKEAADALTGTDQGARLEAEVDKQLAAAREVLRIATRRYEAGYAGYLEVLDAQRGAQDAELALLRARQARLDASVLLFRSLGGGWSPQQS